jgi:hypothetical protein
VPPLALAGWRECHALLRARGAVAGIHGARQIADRTLKPPAAVQHRDARRQRRRGAQVGQHGAGLDRRELVAVTQQHQAGAGRQRLQQPRHQLEVHHRGFIDKQQVQRQRDFGIVAEPARAGQRAQQRMQRARRRQIGIGAPRQRLRHRLAQARRCLAGGCGERHAQRLRTAVQALEQPQQPGRGVGLAGAGAA